MPERVGRLAAAAAIALAGCAAEPEAPQAERPAAAAASAPSPIAGVSAVPSADASGLVLHGITATGAIIGYEGGGQRLVRIGGEVRPGLRLEAVRQHAAVLATGPSTVELGFTGPVESAAPAQASAASPAAPASTPGQRARRQETLAYRLGLAPRREGGRITGFALRPGAQLPLLRRAGLRDGDVLVAVNGQSFESEEKVMELPAEIAGSFDAEFEFERGGRRLRARLPVNPRPAS